MNEQKTMTESKPNGFTKSCRDCDKPIYLHRGTAGPWRAFEPAPADAPDEWVRHRCAAGLQDAELLGIVAPPGTKPAQLVSKIQRLIEDFHVLLDQAEKRAASA
ncbi:MAG: hypothetical protein ACT443_12745 [Gemmatimonadota bacterium]